MACLPDLKVLYGHLYNRLKKASAPENPTSFDLKDYMITVQKLIEQVDSEDQDFALLHLQAVPQLFIMIMASEKGIRDKFRSQYPYDDLQDLSDKFNTPSTGLEAVREYIAVKEIDPEDLRKKLRVLRERSNSVELIDATAEFLLFSDKTNRQRPVTVLVTTGQRAKVVDPTKTTKEEQNIIDEEKTLAEDVTKSIVSIIENKGIVDTVEYKGEKLYLRPFVPTNEIAEKYYASADKKFHYEQRTKSAVVVFLTDSNGDMVFFDENGDFTNEDNGEPVYTFLREVKKSGTNTYEISGYTNIKYALASPADIVKNRVKSSEENGIEISSARQKELEKQIDKLQKEEIEKLYRLRSQVFADPEKVVLLPVVGGSYGRINTTMIPFADTDITEQELKGFRINETANDKKKGRGMFYVNRTNAKTGISGNYQVYMQRGNMNNETAAKIADVLTSNANVKGRKRTLTAEERKAYSDIYLSNAIELNNIVIDIDKQGGVSELVVYIKGKQVDLNSPEARDQIYNHLVKAFLYGTYKKEYYSAIVNYNKNLLGKSVIDYSLEDGILVPSSKKYFDLIKPFVLIEYSNESLPAVKSLNAYLKFSIPDEVIDTDVAAPVTVKKNTIASTFQEGNMDFSVSKSDNYRKVTEDLIDSTDITVSLALNFDTTTEKALKNLAGDEYVGVPIKVTNGKLTISDKALEELIINKLNEQGAQDIFFTGNDITDLVKKKITQKQMDDFVYDLMDRLINSNKLNNFIRTIYTSGQTGVSESFIKAANRLDFPVKVITTSTFTHRIVNNTKKSKFEDVKSKEKFLSRFGIKPEKKTKDTKATAKPKATNNKSTGTPKGPVEPDVKDIFSDEDFESLNDSLFRSKDLKQDYNLTEAEEQEIIDWYKNSPLQGQRPLNIIMGVVNSPAFASFTRSGVNLFKGDGGTGLDIYHEAWHVFSQLFLTKQEKAALYNEVARESGNSRWQPGTNLSKDQIYFEIEEALAEGFRDYKSGKYTPKGKVTKSIFRKILDFIKNLFGGTTQAEYNFHVADIAAVKKMYDTLYKSGRDASVLDKYSPSINNSFFFKLNRAKTIQPVADEDGKKPSENFGEFTIDESKLIKDTMDNLLGLYFQKQALDKENTASGFEQIKTDDMRFEIYAKLQQSVAKIKSFQQTRLDKVLELNKGPKKNLFLQQDLEYKVNLLERVLDNFGDIQESLDRKQKDGVIAYHIANTRFGILREKYIEIEDETSIAGATVFKENNGVNDVDPKSVLSGDTMMLLGSIFKEVRDPETGEAKKVFNELGVQELENPDIIWSKLARTLESSMTPAEMYNKLVKFSANYPEFNQLLDLLPSSKNNITSAEVDMETRFWQDLKKPRIQHFQLNLNQEKDPEGISEEIDPAGTYKAVVINSETDVYSVIREWNNNFVNIAPGTSKFIQIDPGTKEAPSTGNNILNTGAVLKEFGYKGELDKNKAIEFLAALGIFLDKDSAEIQMLTQDPFFINDYGLDRMYESIRLANIAFNSNEKIKVEAAKNFKADPIKYLTEGMPEAIVGPIKSTDVKFRIKMLATIQNKFSNNYSNFSLLNPEMNRVFEHFLDSTVTRNILSINKAENWQQLTTDTGDPNGEFKHMRWLGFKNNPATQYSVILNTLFDFKTDNLDEFGKKKEQSILLFNDTGTQVKPASGYSEGNSTSSADVNSKFLQEMHTMLLRGIQEFMRHASKSTSMGMQVEDIETYDGKSDKYLYVGTKEFQPNTMGYGEDMAANILIGYIAAELGRIQRFKANVNNPNVVGAEKMSNWTGYNRKVRKKDGSVVMAGEVFTAFDDVLTEETKEKLYDLKGDLMDYLEFNDETNIKLGEEIRSDIRNYFKGQVDKNLKRLQEARYVDQGLIEKVTQPYLRPSDIDKTLVKSYTYNSWIHNFETAILGYGDFALYNHEKEEFHKRNAGFAGGGLGIRADEAIINNFINDEAKFPMLYIQKYKDQRKYKRRYYDGTFNTAIIREKEVDSVMYEEYKKILKEDLLERLENNTSLTKTQKENYAEKLSTKEAKEYLGMKEADGQGYINFESYRLMRKLSGRWFSEHEKLYQDIVAGKKVKAADVVRFFPSEKMQYYGNIKTTAGLPMVSFHKFSLAPLIPGVVDGSKLAKMQDMMLQQGVDYVLFESGSKVGHITSDGKADKFLNEDGSVNEALEFTPNIIYAENLKNVTAINDEYKGSAIFATQLRKLILEGLYDQGIIKDTKNKEKADRYIKHVDEYTNLLKLELLSELGFIQVQTATGYEYIPVDASSTEKLADKIRRELERDDTVGDHLIEFIDVNADGTLKHDLSLHPEANKIEKLILSLINKRIIKQRVNGEPFVMVSGAMYEGVFDGSQLKQATEEDRRKYVGSNFLPTYRRTEDGTTAAMKVMVAFHGDFTKLVNVKDKNGKSIAVYDQEIYEDGEGNKKTRLVLNEEATLKKLNVLIKDDAWLNANKGANREAITMVGVRIPVQGLNSMEFMEVYHFLPSTAGNLIIPPAEIVAKSGGDFDIDKMTVFMPNLNRKGKLIQRPYESNEEIKKAYDEAKESGESVSNFFETQKKAIQNELIKDIKDILSIKENYASLIRPNGTYLLKDIADDLAQYVMEFDPYANESSDTPNYKVKKDPADEDQKTISPTRVLEVGYNLYKHESNVVGKRTLGLGAIENTFNILFNSLGAKMPLYYMQEYSKGNPEMREVRMFLKHNKMKVKDDDGKVQEHISLSNKFDAENINKISDIYSQAINGWVDVEKDAWIFFIQGNYEVAPTLLYLIKAGVPVDEAIYFVSQPLVREYVKEQRQAKSTYGDALGKKPKDNYGNAMPQFAKAQASRNVITKYFGKNIKQNIRYKTGTQLADELFEGRKEKQFTKKEMYSLIKDYAKADEDGRLVEGSSDLSKAMFLHYLEIEQQMDGVKKLKFSSNPDTKLRTSLGSAEEAEAKLEDLESESKLDQELLYKMKNDSVTSSFFSGDLALALSRPLFPAAYNPVISDWIITNSKDFDNKNSATFNNRDRMVTTFRNDLIMMLFQNAVRKYAISESYQGYDVSTSIPVEIIKKLEFGAFVKENKSGVPTLYIDKKQLENDFKSKAWMKGTTTKNSYASRGLYPLAATFFSSNKNIGETEFYKFVAEREYLRSVYPISEITEMADFEDQLSITKSEFPALVNEKQVRMTYERILAERALENSFNPQQLFKAKRSAFALQFSSMIKKHPELANKFAILQKMKVDYNADKTRFNLYVNENKYSNSISNLYYKNLKDLANPTIKKVADPAENRRISEFFAKVPMVAFYQAGLNKTKVNFTSVVNYESFIDVLNQEIRSLEGILKSDNSDAFLRAFFNQFVTENKRGKNRNEFKNYFLSDDLSKITDTRDASGQRYGVTETINPQVFVFSNLQAQRSHYQKILDMNPDITLIYNMTAKEVANPTIQFSGQNIIRALSPGAIGLPTSQDTVKDNFSKLAVKDYPAVKKGWEIMFAEAKERLDNGEFIGLSREGYGDPNIMPEELFVYLSKRLFQLFQYINPGSTQYQEVMDTINSMQNITDEEILQIFDEENDPFKCKT